MFFLLYLFLMVSALRRSQNSGLIEITLLSRSFKIFLDKISISVFLLMLVYPWNKWQLGPKLRKSFCCWVKLQSERLIYLSILFCCFVECCFIQYIYIYIRVCVCIYIYIYIKMWIKKSAFKILLLMLYSVCIP